MKKLAALLGAPFLFACGLGLTSGCGAADDGGASDPEAVGSESEALSGVIQHIFVISMENHDSTQIYGNTASAPYINGTLLPMIWDEYGHLVNGEPWIVGSTPTMINPGADQYTIYDVGGRALPAMQNWQLGVQAVTGSLDVSVLYALLEYR